MSASDENKVTTYKDKMIYRRVGNSGLFVSAVSMGTWVCISIQTCLQWSLISFLFMQEDMND